MTFHRLVQRDISEALSYYAQYSRQTEDKFWDDLEVGFGKIEKSPTSQHFDASG